jgi:hypothetical protein
MVTIPPLDPSPIGVPFYLTPAMKRKKPFEYKWNIDNKLAHKVFPEQYSSNGMTDVR